VKEKQSWTKMGEICSEFLTAWRGIKYLSWRSRANMSAVQSSPNDQPPTPGPKYQQQQQQQQQH
jgi:hypothetical protein